MNAYDTHAPLNGYQFRIPNMELLIRKWAQAHISIGQRFAAHLVNPLVELMLFTVFIHIQIK